MRDTALNHIARMQRSRRRLARGPSFRPPSPPSRQTTHAATYIICTNPRSGSWLLSEGLAATALAGNPRNGSTSKRSSVSAHGGAWIMNAI
jgi:hypothetical protein